MHYAWMIMGVASGLALAWKTITDDTTEASQELTRSTGGNLALVALGGVGVYLALKAMEGK